MASPVTVCAVVVASENSGPAAPMLAALERQTRSPQELVSLRPGEDLRAALDGDAVWLWLLDGSAVPEPKALERLLEVLSDPGPLPPPVLLASKIERPDGSLDPSSLPVAQVMDRDVAIAAFERRVVSLRVVRGGSLLVHRRSVEMPGSASSLDPFADDLEWTARLLRQGPGLLVPGSVAVRRTVDPQVARKQARRELLDRLRLLRGDAIDPRDKPWFILRLAEDTLEHMRAAPAADRGLRLLGAIRRSRRGAG